MLITEHLKLPDAPRVGFRYCDKKKYAGDNANTTDESRLHPSVEYRLYQRFVKTQRSVQYALLCLLYDLTHIRRWLTDSVLPSLGRGLAKVCLACPYVRQPVLFLTFGKDQLPVPVRWDNDEMNRYASRYSCVYR